MNAAVEKVTTDRSAVRPFRVEVPEAELTEMRRRIKATRWPEKENVADTSQGVPLAPLQDLTRYWATDYDWRKAEARLNALPNFITEIDGLDIHFIHVRSKHNGALPVIISHGWPGSILEQMSLSVGKGGFLDRPRKLARELLASRVGPLPTKDASCRSPRTDRRSSDPPGGLERFLGGGRP